MDLKLGFKALGESDQTHLLSDSISFFHKLHIKINASECTYIPFDKKKTIVDGDIAYYKVQSTCRFYIHKYSCFMKLHKYRAFVGYANYKYQVFLKILLHYQY